MTSNPGDKLKFTEPGAEALRTWMRRRGVSLAELAQAMETNQMAPGRALKRQGWLTLEQVGRLVAFCGGEVTAAQLVGLDCAAAVPVFPLRQRARPAPPAPAVAPAALDAEDEDDEDPAGLERMRRLGKKGLAALERMVDSPDAAATAVAESAHRLVKNWLAAEALAAEQAKGATAPEAEVLEKLETLLANARRQAEDAEAAASPAVAPTKEPQP